MSEQPARRQLSDYGPVQLADRLGLTRWQIDRALGDGLIPPPGVPGRRWSAPVVEAAQARIDDIRAAAGSVPDLGAVRAAEILSQRFGRDVHPDIPHRAGPPRPDPGGRQLQGPAAVRRARRRASTNAPRWNRPSSAAGCSTADEAAAYLQTRRCDLDHLVRAGWLEAAAWVRSFWRSNVPLYRAVDLDVLAAHPPDREQVRATPPGRPSPLARLAAHST